MSRRETRVTLRQMLDHIEEATALSSSRTRADLESNRMLLLALIKLVEIVGEAARRIPEEIKLKHSGIPWSEIIGTRDRLVHGYDAVDHDILWTIVTEDFPPLATQIEALLQ